MINKFTKDEEVKLLCELRGCYEGAMKAYYTDSDFFSGMFKDDCDKLLDLLLEIQYKRGLN